MLFVDMSTHEYAGSPITAIDATINHSRRTILRTLAATIGSAGLTSILPSSNSLVNCLEDMLALCEQRIATLRAPATASRLNVEAFTSTLFGLEQDLGAPTGDPSGLLSPDLELWTVREVSSLLRGFAWRCVLDEHAPVQCELGYTIGLRHHIVRALKRLQ